MADRDAVRGWYSKRARTLLALDHPWSKEQTTFLKAVAHNQPQMHADNVGRLMALERLAKAATSEVPMSEVTWQRDPEFFGANRAERALIGDYELVVFDLPADRAGSAVIGWELFGPPRHQELIDHGDARTFENAKAAAERAFAKL
jgi:hypothetical protein